MYLYISTIQLALRPCSRISRVVDTISLHSIWASELFAVCGRGPPNKIWTSPLTHASYIVILVGYRRPKWYGYRLRWSIFWPAWKNLKPRLRRLLTFRTFILSNEQRFAFSELEHQKLPILLHWDHQKRGVVRHFACALGESLEFWRHSIILMRSRFGQLVIRDAAFVLHLLAALSLRKGKRF